MFNMKQTMRVIVAYLIIISQKKNELAANTNINQFYITRRFATNIGKFRYSFVLLQPQMRRATPPQHYQLP